ncbi:2Fe-2S iron-sulfur cluster-binding protein [Nocardia abscessus]|jgi:ferredoxin, 2Fe-2S|uniref:2Fe-2S iron-sulfur cluster-binding protein n=1 Tax=Nocardia TaxID=1817 RepID=UPI0018935321|nr:2Fe-2S iron-sulfur cluster-binding protein [Nocardia abscessus]MBF6207862.1 2Fe-2S iron-sulfur cluster binding domain-containing protein [Streptomyces gardneri]MBF6472573.1 2Fe-2S iron-sulfur cluster binding domain-containing protein [Nocardia abscessus]
MPVVVYVLPSGERREIDAEEGQSVMETAVGNLVPGIIGDCGGSLVCATCHVYVDDAWTSRLSSASDYEQDMLECTAAERTDRSRLSCQLECKSELDGIVVHVPEEQ